MKKLLITCILLFLVLPADIFSQGDTDYFSRWSSENLDVEHFRDGTPIKQAKSLDEWFDLGNNSQPAWCYYDFDSTYSACGKIYNKFAIEDRRKLAPVGYKIPTKEEWDSLFFLVDRQYKVDADALIKAESYGIYSEYFKSNDNTFIPWNWSGFYEKEELERLKSKYNYTLNFDLLACGYLSKFIELQFNGMGSRTAFWTTSPAGSNSYYEVVFISAYGREFESNGYVGNWSTGYYVRLITDENEMREIELKKAELAELEKKDLEKKNLEEEKKIRHLKEIEEKEKEKILLETKLDKKFDQIKVDVVLQINESSSVIIATVIWLGDNKYQYVVNKKSKKINGSFSEEQYFSAFRKAIEDIYDIAKEQNMNPLPIVTIHPDESGAYGKLIDEKKQIYLFY